MDSTTEKPIEDFSQLEKLIGQEILFNGIDHSAEDNPRTTSGVYKGILQKHPTLEDRYLVDEPILIQNGETQEGISYFISKHTLLARRVIPVYS